MSIISSVTVHIDSDVRVTPPVNMDHSTDDRTSVFLSHPKSGFVGVQLAGSVADLRAVANNLHIALSLIEAQLKETANV